MTAATNLRLLDSQVGELWSQIWDEADDRAVDDVFYGEVKAIIRKLVEERAQSYGSVVLAKTDPLYEIAIKAALRDFGIDEKEWTND